MKYIAAFLISLLSASSVLADNVDQHNVTGVCERLAAKLGSVTLSNCLSIDFELSGGQAESGTPIIIKEYPPLPERREPLGRVLVLGGIHGDEYSAVSMVFKWLNKLEKYHSGIFHWRLAPSVNPDGLLRKKSQRMNANGVDLNRNFPTLDWEEKSTRYWKKTRHNKRRYPGVSAASEAETQWVIDEINTFQPDVIVQIHAPYGIIDFDGKDRPPRRLGNLHLNLLGTYPGSLGNYGAMVNDIPVVTVELANAGIMPPQHETNKIWGDLVGWLKHSLPRDGGLNTNHTPQSTHD